MPLNQNAILSILMEEVAGTEERCEGYREALTDVIADIVTLERQHKIQQMNIQQKIGDKFNATGKWLADSLGDIGREGKE